MHEDWFVCPLPKSLSKEKTKKLLKARTKEDRNLLISHNIRLVIYEILNKFPTVDYDKKELVSIGIIGLINAIDTYDISRKIEFSNYAIKCIDNEILKFLRTLKKDKIVSSLEQVIYINDEGSELQIKDILLSGEDLEKYFENKDTYRIIRNIIEKLPNRDKEIIKLYFGFYDNKQYSQPLIAHMYSISQAQVSRIIAKRLKQIKNILESKDIIETKKKVKKRLD